MVNVDSERLFCRNPGLPFAQQTWWRAHRVEAAVVIEHFHVGSETCWYTIPGVYLRFVSGKIAIAEFASMDEVRAYMASGQGRNYGTISVQLDIPGEDLHAARLGAIPSRGAAGLGNKHLAASRPHRDTPRDERAGDGAPGGKTFAPGIRLGHKSGNPAKRRSDPETDL